MAGILALHTSSEACSVAWRHADGLCRMVCPSLQEKSSATLLPEIARLMESLGDASLRPSALAFAAGPGMFTGVRLGCSVVQGLALAWSLPVLEVCSLACVTEGQPGERFWVVTDARMGEVFAAAFERRAGVLHGVLPVGCYAPDAVPLPPGPGWIGLGNGFACYGASLAQRAGTALIEQRPTVVGDASGVAHAASALWAAGQVSRAASVAPHYVRDKVAQTVAERMARGLRA